MSEPRQKPHASKQTYATPKEFLDAVEARFGRLGFDLAAEEHTAVAGPVDFFAKEDDALKQDWLEVSHSREFCWLNPPFGDIASFAEKCALESRRGVRILMLVPASIGSNWFRDHVLGKAMVLGLNPRMSFDGIAMYPKDLMLCVYAHGVNGFDQWVWKDKSR
jgi:phage N-6-adenine-methyltransferase